jgi:GNAT superfamily N-acetyltransferase
MKLRRAIIDDLLAMGRLWKALVIEENPTSNPDVERWSELQRRMFKMPDYYAYVVEDDRVVVGFNNGLVLKDFENGDIYVDGGNFYVLPEYRKGAAGAMLHRNSFEIAKKLGAKWLRRKVSANNERMVRRFLTSKKCILKEYIVDEMIGGSK